MPCSLAASPTPAGHRCLPAATAPPPPLQDIYLARAEGLLATEERLYWRLIDLYRLPAMLYTLTGPNPGPLLERT